MISSIKDLKNRTLVESNTLKSFILASNANPRAMLDDILIHDYQIANSVTINSILSNYIVDMYRAVDDMRSDKNGLIGDSYFQIINTVDRASLQDSTRLFLELDEGKGSFTRKDFIPQVESIDYDNGTIKFVNLDTIWYGLVRTQIIHNMEGEPSYDGKDGVQYESGEYLDSTMSDMDNSWETIIYYDNLLVSPGMNNDISSRNSFGQDVNPFNAPMEYLDGGIHLEDRISFNQYLRNLAINERVCVKVNCIIENSFYRTEFLDDQDSARLGISDANENDYILKVIPKCRYLACLTNGFFGIETVWEVDEHNVNQFHGLRMHNLGNRIRNLVMSEEGQSREIHDLQVGKKLDVFSKYEFTNCDFKVVNGQTTLFVVFKENEPRDGEEFPRYRYLYLNPDDFDFIYGFPEIKSLVNDQMIVPPDDVFHKVEYIKQLDAVAIAMTDYGFWDIEPNRTNDVVYSYRGLKKYHESVEYRNTDPDKNVLPTFDGTSDTSENDKVVEYDLVWRRAEDYYNCYKGSQVYYTEEDLNKYGNGNENDNPISYPAIVLSGNAFVGGNQYFAVYDRDGDISPIQIFAQIRLDQFKTLVFSDTTLMGIFVNWLYDQVVYENRGQEYLRTMHSEFVSKLNGYVSEKYLSFQNQEHQVTAQDSLVDTSKFGSIRNIALDRNPSASTLLDYCSTLENLKSIADLPPDTGLGWLMSKSALEAVLEKDFAGVNPGTRGKWFNDHLDSVVEDVVSNLVQRYRPLEYFKSYLITHIKHDFEWLNSCSVNIDINSITQVIGNALAYIKSKVNTALILGGYDGTKAGNNRYPGINQFIYQNQIKLKKTDIQGMMSPLNTLNEISSAVQSMDFFKKYSTYGGLATAEDENLFKLDWNSSFIGLSGYVDDNDNLKVNWSQVREWLFTHKEGGATVNRQTEEDILKAFLRTQFYRSMYFNAGDFLSFSSNENEYRCTTIKSYVNHDLEEHILSLDWSDIDNPQVDYACSGLYDPSKEGYDSDHIKNASYSKSNNSLTYYIHSDPIAIENGKFVYDDVEFYVVRNEIGKLNSIYFNEFQKNLKTRIENIVIDTNNEFEIRSEDSTTVIRYRIRNNVLEILDTTITEPFPNGTYRQEIVDSSFVINGIRYVIKHNEAGWEVISAEVVDRKLNHLLISTDRTASYHPWSMKFTFNETGTQVVIVKMFQTTVKDVLDEEWCAFDDETVEIDHDRTYDWYLSNRIASLVNDNIQVSLLGKGNLYNGLLNTECTVGIDNEIQNGEIYTKCIVTIGSGDDIRTQTLGVIYDSDCELIGKKVFRGNMSSDNLIIKDDNGNSMFILKDEACGNNNVNSIWVDFANVWLANQSVNDVGKAQVITETDAETGESSTRIQITFDDTSYYKSELTLIPSDGNTYIVRNGDTSMDDSYGVKHDNVIHFIAPVKSNGNIAFDRFILDLDTSISASEPGSGDAPATDDEGGEPTSEPIVLHPVSKLVFTPMTAHTMDFSTQYTYNQLRNNLASNIKQSMMNDIIRRVNEPIGSSTDGWIVFSSDRLGLYLDMFPDQSSAQNYEIVAAPESSYVEKYLGVFKNSLVEVDESKIYLGAPYQHLAGLMNNMFGQGTAISLLDRPSIEVTRVSNTDRFTYTAFFDLYIKVDKKIIKNNESYVENYILGNAVIKDVECKVVFTPVLNSSNAQMKMTYDVTYTVTPGQYDVEYDQIIYTHDGKTKQKTLDEAETVRVGGLFTGTHSIVRSVYNMELESITSELVSGLVKNTSLFPNDKMHSIYALINGNTNIKQKEVNRVQEYNKYMDNGVWGFGITSKPVNGQTVQIPPENAIFVSKGKSVIGGELYTLEDREVMVNETPVTEYYLKQANGTDEIKLVVNYAHTSSSPENQTFDVWDNSKQDYLVGIRSEEVVDTEYLKDHFDFHMIDGYDFIATFKGTYDKFPVDQGGFAEFTYIHTEDQDHLPESVQSVTYIERPQGQSTQMILGSDLTEEGDFIITLSKNDYESAVSDGSIDIDQVFNGYIETLVSGEGGTQQTTSNGWQGFAGKFTLKIQGLKTDSPSAVIDNITPCNEFSTIPQEKIHTAVRTEYIPTNLPDRIDEHGNTIVDNSNGVVDFSLTVNYIQDSSETQLESNESELGGEGDDDGGLFGGGTSQDSPESGSDEYEEVVDEPDDFEDTVTIRFRVNFAVTKYDVFDVPANGTSYYDNNLLVYTDGSGDTNLQNALQIFDFRGYGVGGLSTAFAWIPVNLDEENSEDYRYDYKNVFFELDRSGDSDNWETEPGFTNMKRIKDGKVTSFFKTSGRPYYQSSFGILHPDEKRQNEWDIYDRYYITELIEEVEHNTTTPDDSTDKLIWMNKASSVKSINAGQSMITWRGDEGRMWDQVLLDDCVPKSIEDKIRRHIASILKMEDYQFVISLTQLQTFFSMIQRELAQSIEVNDIIGLCKFGYTANVGYRLHNPYSEFNDTQHGLFGYETGYNDSLARFDEHLKNEFAIDHARTENFTGDISERDYNLIIDDAKVNEITTNGTGTARRENAINIAKADKLKNLWMDVYGLSDGHIASVFGNAEYNTTLDPIVAVDRVKYINVIPTSIQGSVKKMYLIDGYCHLFTEDDGEISWYKFDASSGYVGSLLDKKASQGHDYKVSVPLQLMDNAIKNDTDDFFRFANREFGNGNQISDAFIIHCRNNDIDDMWYLSELDSYIYTRDPLVIKDIAYEQIADSVYVIFNDDNHLYRYDHLSTRREFDGTILLSKEIATQKIDTFHSIAIPDSDITHSIERIYIDYETSMDEERNASVDWNMTIWGRWDRDGMPTRYDCEEWLDSPGRKRSNHRQYNTIIFGDTLFSDHQMKFHNISQNKEMFDILDVDEVDGYYYGLFKTETYSRDGESTPTPTYTVFKTPDDGGVVERLPYEIIMPSLIRTKDNLYSLYVLIRDESGKVKLQEISVPDSPLYEHRSIDIQDIITQALKTDDRQNGSDENSYEDLEFNEFIMSRFIPGNSGTDFFVLSNYGFHKVGYTDKYTRISIDSLQEFVDNLTKSIRDVIINEHEDEKHRNVEYFTDISRKINQFDEDFTAFRLIPTEFGQTQDVGVVPSSIIDDTDTSNDHRVDSVTVATDILQTDGLTIASDVNPGFITCAVSNPATTYDNDRVFVNSQRNPSLEGTEFYDYIYDQDGNEIMDMYQIPFIYRINSNNTYDLYINVPTTRTKYLNRVTGTLKPDNTSFVLKTDTRTRRNFLDEALSNNLDESTTRLRVYIDRKWISVGNVELVEISGNSIPQQIYRDTVNNGLYDSIALESRWNGEVVEINEPEQDINKVMLEFECYGTDSQSIHITGKTLVNEYLNDDKYQFESE